MAATRSYLDYNATAPLRAAALEACLQALGVFGNPSSVHREGREARRLIENARASVGCLLGQGSDRITFTSGGTEAANTLLIPGLGAAGSSRGAERLIVSATEHAAVLHGHGFPAERVTVLSVDWNGQIDLGELADILQDDGGRPALLALQAANNETGVVQPVKAAAALVHEAGGVLVCDAVQAVGRIPFSLADCDADAAFISGHKIGGPKGIGAIVLAEGVSPMAHLIRGGGQERGLRSGTENVVGIAGLGAAADEAAESHDEARLQTLRDSAEAALRDARDDVVVFGAHAKRLPNTTCFAVPGLAAETLLMALDLQGVAVSSGAACSSGKVSRSHVLDAMGIEPALGAGAVRVSFGWASTEADVGRFRDVLGAVMQRMHRRSMPQAA